MTSINIASLIVDGSQAISELNRVGNTFDNVRGMVGGVAVGATKAFVAMAAGVTALYIAGSNAVEALDNTATAIEGTIGAVQSLELAANGAGANFENIQQQIIKFNVALNDSDPDSNANKALNQLGLSAKQLLAMDVDQRIQTLAGAFDDLGYSTSQQVAMLKRFGVEGRELVKIMGDGGEAISEAKKQLEQYGLLLSKQDGANVQAANDAWDKMGIIIGGVNKTFSSTLAPTVKATINYIIEAAAGMVNFGSVGRTAGEWTSKAFLFLLDAIDGVWTVTKAVAQAFTYFTLTAVSGLSQINEIIIGPVFDGINLLIDGLNSIPGFDIKFRFDSKAITEQAKETTETIKGTMAGVAEAFEANLLKPLAGTAIGAKKVNEEIKKIPEAVNLIDPTVIDKLKKSFDDLWKSTLSPVGRNQAELAEKEKLIKKAESSEIGSLNKIEEARRNLYKERSNLMVNQYTFGEEFRRRETIDANTKMEEDVARTNLHYAYEEAALNKHFDDNMKRLSQDLKDKHVTETEAAVALMVAKSQYEQDAKTIEDDTRNEKLAQEKIYRETALSGASDMFGNLSTLMQSHSRKQFEIGKAAAIGKAIIDTYTAAQGAYSSLAGIPIIGPALGAAAAGAAVIAGMARVSAIKSQSFGGGSSTAAASSAAGGGGGGGSSAAPPAAAAPQQRTTNINVSQTDKNVGLDPSTSEMLFGQINKASKDGRVNVGFAS